MTDRSLPSFPEVILVSRDRADPDAQPFLRIRRLDVEVRDVGGTLGHVRYDIVDRRALDAVVMVVHARIDGRPHVFLRSAIRPPVWLRVDEPLYRQPLWEVPAGLIDPGETPRAAAAREIHEELGFTVDGARLAVLGEWTFPAPGVIGEVHHFFHVEVDPAAQEAAPGDGSVLETALASICVVPLEEALRHCTSGAIRDAKTELALRRLAERLG